MIEEDGHEGIATDPGGDMTDGVARAHLETTEEIQAVETDIAIDVQPGEPAEGVTIANRRLWQHAKVILLMVSVGQADEERSYEDYAADVKQALLDRGVKAVTETGGYYLINGQVCLPHDYDPVAHDFKPGAHPPPWAGGKPVAQREQISEEASAAPVLSDTPDAKPGVKEDTVRALAQNLNEEVTTSVRRGGKLRRKR